MLQLWSPVWRLLLLLLLLLLSTTTEGFIYVRPVAVRSTELWSSRLHGILELQFANQLIGDADLPPYLYEAVQKTKGREAVAEAGKAIQRLQLMLDRSDGRPDMTSDMLAEKYSAFLSTCLRTPGGAWTASLGPMDYVGVKLDQHVTTTTTTGAGAGAGAKQRPGSGGAVVKELDLKSLFRQMASCLIDLDVSAPVPAALQAEEAHRKVLDLSLAMVRVATRYAILADQLVVPGSDQPVDPFSFRLMTRGDVGAYEMLSLDALRTTMRLDFKFHTDVSSDGMSLEVKSKDVQTWRESHLL